MSEATDESPPSCSPSPASLARTRIAVSIKQPWATLVVHGLKTIGLRRWRPRVRGLVYIHTGASADPCEEGWSRVPESLARFAQLRRGLVGRVVLGDVKRYDTLEQFHADRDCHLAPERWFGEGGLFGWSLSNPERVPFEPCPGNLRFFRV